MTRAKWYVIQVESGQERRMSELIAARCEERNALAEEPGEVIRLEECFAPRFTGQRKRQAGWEDIAYALLPGYVVAAVDDPAKLAVVLRGIPDFCRIVTNGERYLPLNEGERTWIEAYTQKGNRVIPMSFGYRDEDGLKVVDGPLRGQEAIVTGVNRSASLAYLEFHVGTMTIKTTVGLAIVPKGKLAIE